MNRELWPRGVRRGRKVIIKENMEQKNKLYVGNLPYSVDSEGLSKIFAEHGEITEAVVISDKFSGRSKGFGFVTFKDEAAAQAAAKAMDGKEVEGRELRVNVAQPMKPRD